MNGFELKLWRLGFGWNQAKAATELGVSLRTYCRYEQDSPPRVVALAIKAISLTSMLPAIADLEETKLRKRIEILAKTPITESLVSHKDILHVTEQLIKKEIQIYQSVSFKENQEDYQSKVLARTRCMSYFALYSAITSSHSYERADSINLNIMINQAFT